MSETFPNDPLESALPDETVRVQRGGRDTMIDTAERIGNAVGTAQRQVRRGLELVRNPKGHGHAADFPGESGYSAQTAERPRDMWREVIAEQYADAKQRASVQLEQWRAQASERTQKLRSDTKDYAEAHPMPTIGAIAAAGFLLGFALRRSKRSHRG